MRVDNCQIIQNGGFDDTNGDIANVKSEVQEFFNEKQVLITGVTGFFGKALAEKLLRSCTGLKKLYILIRPKRGKDVLSRFDDIFENVVFDRVRKEVPNFKQKIVLIPGDCERPDLGLTLEDRKTLIDKVNVIFHSAATVKFDEHLRIALATNTRAPLDLLKMAKEMKNLNAFMHISTTYCQPFLSLIEERVYPCHADYDNLQKRIDLMSDNQIDETLSSIIGEWPNTYTFTKALIEKELSKRRNNLPVCIFRPAVVSAAAREPLKGWIDNSYGPTGIAIGCMTGMLRTMQCDATVSAEIIPVDFAVNCLLVATVDIYKTHKRCLPETIPVYNYVSSVENKMTYGDFRRQTFAWVEVHPFSNPLWYRMLNLNTSYIVNEVHTFFLHLLPALLIDFLLVCSGRKPRILKTYNKIHKFASALSYFTLRHYLFCNRRVRELWQRTSKLDKRVFPFSMKELDWDEYYSEYLLGIRRYLFKDGDDTLPQARKKWRRLYYLHQTVCIIFGAALVYGLWSFISKFRL